MGSLVVDNYRILVVSALLMVRVFFLQTGAVNVPSSHGNNFVIGNEILQCVECFHRTELVVDDFLLSIKDSCRQLNV